MLMRTFQGHTMADAVKLLKTELGRDAVILDTKEVRSTLPGGGPLTMVEITATSAAQSASFAPGQVKIERPRFPRVERADPATLVRGGGGKAVPPSTAPPPLVERVLVDVQGNELLKQVAHLQEEILRARKEMASLPLVNVGQQMEEVKVLLHDLMRHQAVGAAGEQPGWLTDLLVRLRAGGVAEGILSDLGAHLLGLPALGKDGCPPEAALAAAIGFVYERILVAGAGGLGEGALHCLVGPTGVGKTTTLAKIAARAKLTEGKRVALVSLDRFRVGGSQQLAIYGKILECPFAEVADGPGLKEFCERQWDADLVLVDTAGLGLSHGTVGGELLADLRGLGLPLRFHLVLSSSMKQRDVDETVRGFAYLRPESLIFTKLDESWSFGEILNSSHRSRIPLSFFTTGQRVPEDLELASKERVVERLFRL